MGILGYKVSDLWDMAMLGYEAYALWDMGILGYKVSDLWDMAMLGYEACALWDMGILGYEDIWFLQFEYLISLKCVFVFWDMSIGFLYDDYWMSKLLRLDEILEL